MWSSVTMESDFGKTKVIIIGVRQVRYIMVVTFAFSNV